MSEPQDADGPGQRQQGDRFREGDDVFDQLDQIEKRQAEVQGGKIPGVIDSIEKSKQRVKNKLKEIRRLDDLKDL